MYYYCTYPTCRHVRKYTMHDLRATANPAERTPRTSLSLSERTRPFQFLPRLVTANICTVRLAHFFRKNNRSTQLDCDARSENGGGGGKPSPHVDNEHQLDIFQKAQCKEIKQCKGNAMQGGRGWLCRNLRGGRSG